MRSLFKHYGQMPSIIRGTTNTCLGFTLFLLVPVLYIFAPYLDITYRINDEIVPSDKIRDALGESHILGAFTLIGSIALFSAINLLKKKKWTRFLLPTAAGVVILVSLVSVMKSEGTIFDLFGGGVLITLFAWLFIRYKNNEAVKEFYA